MCLHNFIDIDYHRMLFMIVYTIPLFIVNSNSFPEYIGSFLDFVDNFLHFVDNFVHFVDSLIGFNKLVNHLVQDNSFLKRFIIDIHFIINIHFIHLISQRSILLISLISRSLDIRISWMVDFMYIVGLKGWIDLIIWCFLIIMCMNNPCIISLCLKRNRQLNHRLMIAFSFIWCSLVIDPWHLVSII